MASRTRFKKVAIPLLVISALALTACSAGGSDANSNGKQDITMWFWGAPPARQDALNENLVDAFNDSQDDYSLTVEYRNSVDDDIQVALSSGQGGPDVVYGSGPSFVSPYAQAGKLLPMDEYADEFGWNDTILESVLQAGTVDDSLYALTTSTGSNGVFYSKSVLEDNGWEVPTTIDEMTTIMDDAIDKGMYGALAGNQGFQPTNANFSTQFLTSVAGPDNMYAALSGDMPWTDQVFVDAIDASKEWYDKGYLGGTDYNNINISTSLQLLSDGKSPFALAPTIAFQWAGDYFNEEAGNVDDLGFFALPSINEDLASPLYPLSEVNSLSINASSKNPDGAAAVIDFMMQPEFLKKMTVSWPGYFGIPLKDAALDPADYTGLSAKFVTVFNDMTEAYNTGNYGYSTTTFFPPITSQDFIDIDTVWNDQMTTEEYLSKVDTDFQAELADGAVSPVPAP